MDWQEQLRSSVTSLDELRARGFQVQAQREAFPMRITPHVLSLMERDTASCPIGRQFVPLPEELEAMPAELADPVDEDRRAVAGVLVHAYPDRALLLAAQRCATYCRHCFRKRLVGRRPPPTAGQLEQALSYLETRPEIHEVILSGGDPLVLPDAQLDALLGALRQRLGDRVLRIHSRVLSTLPQRITQGLVDLLEGYGVLYLVTQINHPREITPETQVAARRLRKAGIVLANQCVLLRGVNADLATMRQLCLALYRIGIRPYYLFQCDYTQGTAHFRTTLAEGRAIARGLEGRISGPAVPRYAIDCPGIRKVLITADSCTPRGDGTYLLRNSEGQELIYDEPGLTR
ncbi:MAG: KamA family radical SAM protein [Thermodesulfobacteriota bacterium]